MALDWLSRLLNGFSVFLGGSNSRSVWSNGRGSVFENVFQDSQLRKFEPTNTFNLVTEKFNTQMQLLSNFTHATEAVNRLNQQREIDISFIDSEIKTLRGITISDPEYTSPNYERVGKRGQPWEVAGRPFSYGAGGGVRRRYWINPVAKAEYEARHESEVREFATYKTNALSQISQQLGILTERRDLIPSKFSL